MPGLLGAVPAQSSSYLGRTGWTSSWTHQADSGCSSPGIIPENYLLELADHNPQRGRPPHGVKRCAVASNPRSLALPPAMAPSPRHRSHFSFVRPLPRRDRRDFSGSRGSFWPALAVAVPPAAPPPPPPRLRALVFERVRLAVRAAADCAETLYRGAPWVVGRTVPVSSCYHIPMRRCCLTLNTNSRPGRLTLESFW